MNIYMPHRKRKKTTANVEYKFSSQAAEEEELNKNSWLKKLTDAAILKPQKIGRTTYYINYKLMEILAAN